MVSLSSYPCHRERPLETLLDEGSRLSSGDHCSRLFSERISEQPPKWLEESWSLTFAPVPDRTETLELDRPALFARFDSWINRLTRRYHFSAEARQDLRGELYCRFCTLLDNYEPERGIPLMAYLYRQLSAFLYSYARGNRRRQSREVHLGDFEIAETSLMSVPDPTGDWDDRLMRDQFRTLLPLALRQIPARQRRVLTWRFYHELSFQEIASRMCIQPATVRSLLRHGLNSVRDWMERKQMLLD